MTPQKEIIEQKKIMEQINYWEKQIEGKEVADFGKILMDVESAQALALTLKKNRTLRSLTVQPLNDAAVEAIAGALEINTTLLSIAFKKLWDGNIGDNGVKALADALLVNASLLEINIAANTPLTKNVTIALANAIQINSTLRRFELSCPGVFCSLEVEEAMAFADVIKANKTLEYLTLSCRNINTASIITLTDALIVNKTLRHFFLFRGPRFNRKEMQAISAALDINHWVNISYWAEPSLLPDLQSEIRKKLERNTRNRVQAGVTDLHKQLASVLQQFSHDVIDVVSGYVIDANVVRKDPYFDGTFNSTSILDLKKMSEQAKQTAIASSKPSRSLKS